MLEWSARMIIDDKKSIVKGIGTGRAGLFGLRSVAPGALLRSLLSSKQET